MVDTLLFSFNSWVLASRQCRSYFIFSFNVHVSSCYSCSKSIDSL